MTAKTLAESILAEVYAKTRDLISPGNLQQVPISQQEAVDLGLNPPDESRWNPFITLTQLQKIAES